MNLPQRSAWSWYLVFCAIAFYQTITVRGKCADVKWQPGQFEKRSLAAVIGTSTLDSSSRGSTFTISTSLDATPTANATVPVDISPLITTGNITAGQVNCRYAGSTEDMDINYYTCTALAIQYGISVENFFLLNPELQPDCGNIQPNTDYCVQGCKMDRYLFDLYFSGMKKLTFDPLPVIEPLRATAGLCGPPNNNATCLGTEFQCCNGNTFTCGNST